MSKEKNTEVGVVKAQITKALTAAESLMIKTVEDMNLAGELKQKIKKVGKMLKERKEEITKPMNEALKSARELFRPLESQFEEAEGIVNKKMLTFQAELQAEARRVEEEANKKMAETQRKLEAGEITEATAKRTEKAIEKKIENAPEVPVRGESFHTRNVRKYRIVDVSKIPLEYLVPNEIAIRSAMYKDIAIAGVEYFTEAVLV